MGGRNSGKKMELTDNVAAILEFINANDVFWLTDLRTNLGCDGSDIFKHTNQVITVAIKTLKDKGLLNGEAVGGKRKYMRIMTIVFEDLSHRKTDD